MNVYGAKFLENSFAEYIAVHDYQNVMNLDYYFNIFQPDCVVFEVAEYAMLDDYFSFDTMKAMELNPALSSLMHFRKQKRNSQRICFGWKKEIHLQLFMQQESMIRNTHIWK